ncbi:MAG: ABC transporter permease [Sulfuricurvum sp.]|uniref:ABC transporter permease n=1 Tax=Sulfuricurvum sp. TaxID=2025608 RepID=UPI002627EE91|nr:ABC transporter permease [Sulfuricurvum sp.]MDD5160393.1 ABC transporter permease [Sulfuricurvum sp.]
MQSSSTAHLEIINEHSHTLLQCSGMWTLPYLSTVAYQLETLNPESSVIWDVSHISEIDSAGIALWQLYHRAFEHKGLESKLIGANPDHDKLYRLLYSHTYEPEQPPKTHSWLYVLGHETHQNILGIGTFLAFLGEAFVLLVYTLLHPTQIRYRSIVAHIFATGATALPIIALSAFLIGVVVAYQSIVQLQKFGADIFIVDMIGISLTRELAPLITAIVVAGRSGSAFTAQIGAMKMTQEIDAMKTMGFDPFTFLVWPRVIALMIVMPLLIFFADIIGIFGGMVIAQAQSHLSFSEFVHRLQGALPIKHYIIGVVKGPFFAFLIAIVSTYRGFQVSMNTESIGYYTTKSVVNSIFLVIACDAIFSVLLTELKL